MKINQSEKMPGNKFQLKKVAFIALDTFNYGCLL